MTKNDILAITQYVATKRGNCGNSEKFWLDFFALLNSLVNVRGVSTYSDKSINLPDKDFITITDDGKKKTSEIVAELRTHFPVWCYDEPNLDKDFPAVKKPTSRKFKYIQEADPDNANKSARDMEGIDCITLRERLLFELIYWKAEGKHLDVHNWTLCSGSRYRDGHVPGVDWRGDGKLGVSWWTVGNSHERLRSRSVLT